MQNFDDELARRRAARRQQGGSADPEPEGTAGEEEEIPRFTWSDTLAMIIAAYQVLMPMVLAMAGVLVGAYFLFKWIFQ